MIAKKYTPKNAGLFRDHIYNHAYESNFISDTDKMYVRNCAIISDLIDENNHNK